MRALILHLQAPLMSFGRPQTDQIGPTGRFPTLSQVTGLIANALGFTHREYAATQALQERLSLASALVREGEELRDFQTVDLGQSHLRQPAWTTRGTSEHRLGGPDAKFGTHIRQRFYRADASIVSALSLVPEDQTPTVREISKALVRPVRPLVIGRKPCLPSTRMFIGVIDDAASLESAIQRVPLTFPDRWRDIAGDLPGSAEIEAEWPVDDRFRPAPQEGLSTHRVIDQRDWRNQLMGGERVVARGQLKMAGKIARTKGDAP